MSEILAFIPQPVQVAINGKSYGVLPFTVNEMAKLQSWLNSVARNPYESLLSRLGDLPVDARKEVLAAIGKWHAPSIGSEEANEYLNTLDGLQALFSIILKKADPSLTDADIVNIQSAYTLNAFTDLMTELTEIAFGKSDDPKVQ